MKNKLIAILLLVTMAFTVTGCSSDSNSSVVEDVSVGSTSTEPIFTRYPIDDHYSILVKKDNGVCYLEHKYLVGWNCGTYGITVMLNPDGTPEIWDGNY